MEDDHAPLDLDVFPMDNSSTKKEGIFLPDNVFDGHATKYAVYNTRRTVKGKNNSGAACIP